MCYLTAVDEDSVAQHVGKLNQPCDSAGPFVQRYQSFGKSYLQVVQFLILLVELQPTNR